MQPIYNVLILPSFAFFFGGSFTLLSTFFDPPGAEQLPVPDDDCTAVTLDDDGVGTAFAFDGIFFGGAILRPKKSNRTHMIDGISNGGGLTFVS